MSNGKLAFYSQAFTHLFSMKRVMTKTERKTRLAEAIKAQAIEREKNLRLMLAKGEISKEEFDQKICKTVLV